MIQLYVFMALTLTSNNMLLFDFYKDSDLENWTVVDDGVMGGRSEGHFILNIEGNAVFPEPLAVRDDRSA